MVLAILTIIWLVVIGSYVKEKTTSKSGDSVSAFHAQLSTLQRTQPGRRSSRSQGQSMGAARRLSPSPAALSNEARMRRRNVLFTLVGVALFTFVLALAIGTVPFIMLNVVADLLAAGYVVLLVNQQRIAQEQRAKVRRISEAPSLPARARYTIPTAIASGQRYP